jgi:branched-chain amino acid transport system substrate-binding protein
MAATRSSRSAHVQRRALAVGFAGVALVAGACGSSKSSTSSTTAPAASATTSGAATTAPAADPLGTPTPATGSPLKIGYITDGQSGSIDNLSEIPAAQAAVKYLNAYKGGVAGHVLSLDVCDNNDTPAGATNCANQMVTDKVPVVLYNVDGQGATTYAGTSAAGIPLVAYATAVSSELTGKHSYVLTNGIAASFAGPAKIAENVGAKHAAVFVIDVPAASGPAKQLDPIIFKNAGIPVDVVAVAPGTADMTPQVQAELSKGVDFVQDLGDVSFCTSELKAQATLGFKGTTTLIAQCTDSGSAAGIPGGYTGMKVVTTATTDPTDPDVKIYLAAMAKYGAGTNPFANGVTQGGFAAVWAFGRAMSGLTGDATPASVEATLAAMAPTPLPFLGGGTFQCNGQQVSIAPAVCSSGALAETLDQNGKAVGSFTPLDTSALLKLG